MRHSGVAAEFSQVFLREDFFWASGRVAGVGFVGADDLLTPLAFAVERRRARLFSGCLAVEVAVPRLDGAFGTGEAVLLLSPRSCAHGARGGGRRWWLVLRLRCRLLLGLLRWRGFPAGDLLFGLAGEGVDGVVDLIPVILDDVVDSFSAEFNEAVGHLTRERRPRAWCDRSGRLIT